MTAIGVNDEVTEPHIHPPTVDRSEHLPLPTRHRGNARLTDMVSLDEVDPQPVQVRERGQTRCYPRHGR